MDHRVARVIRWIGKNPAKRPSVSELAAQVRLGPRQLQRLFRKETGLSIIGWSRRQRMEEAAILLANTDLKIAEIADQLGYDWPEHLARDFKGFSSLTPSQFRDQNHTR